MIFRQLFDPETSTYSYLLGDALTREAVLIDSLGGHSSSASCGCCTSSTCGSCIPSRSTSTPTT